MPEAGHEGAAGVLLVGANGLVGGALHAALRGPVFCPGRAELDLGDTQAVEHFIEAHGIRVILNAAGAAGRPWREMFEAHAFLARTLAEVAGRTGALNVYLSSSRVFNGEAGEPFAETARPDPRDDYGISKFLGECYTRAGRSLAPAHVLRFPMVLGLRPGSPDRQLATRLLRDARLGRPVRVAADVTAQAVHVQDLAEAIRRFLSSPPPPGDYHLTCPGTAPLHRILATLFARLGLPEPSPVSARDLQPTGHLALNLALAPGALAPLPRWEDAVARFASDIGAQPEVSP